MILFVLGDDEDYDEDVGEDGVKYSEAEWIKWQLEQEGSPKSKKSPARKKSPGRRNI